MKTTGQCFMEFVEFPIMPFDPAIFGFIKDVSSASSPTGCPSFATDDDAYRLWWNWPHVEEREWYASMSQFFITRPSPSGKHDPQDHDPLILFKTENLADLVRHLLVSRYALTPHFLDGEVTETRAIEWFRALESAQLGVPLDGDSKCAKEGERSFLTETELSVVNGYVAHLRSALGDKVFSVAEKARLSRI